MATIRINRGKWQAIVRRTGFPQQSKSFDSKTNARKWARQKEAELDAGIIHTDDGCFRGQLHDVVVLPPIRQRWCDYGSANWRNTSSNSRSHHSNDL